MNHFHNLRPLVKGYTLTNHFKRDLHHDAEQVAEHIFNSPVDEEELHKFEETRDGNHIFRAKIKGVHIVYVVTKLHELIFLRAFKDFTEYKKYLEHLKL